MSGLALSPPCFYPFVPAKKEEAVAVAVADAAVAIAVTRIRKSNPSKPAKAPKTIRILNTASIP